MMLEPYPRFAHPEQKSIALVPESGNDSIIRLVHNFRMAKPRHDMERQPRWYVAEWLVYLKMQQTDLVEATGRSKGRVSELVSGKQRFNDDDLLAFSEALGVTRGYLLDVNPLSADGKAIVEPGRIKRGILPPPPVPPSKNPLKTPKKA